MKREEISAIDQNSPMAVTGCENCKRDGRPPLDAVHGQASLATNGRLFVEVVIR